MPGRKRTLEDPSSSHKSKKTKVSLKKSNKSSGGHDVPVHSILEQEKIDFPRGGGTTLTPQEVKEIRAEGVKEADKELFFTSAKATATRRGKSDPKVKSESSKKEMVRVEHLNYKRLFAGMKVLGQIVCIQALALVISLPNQLVAHVPITQVTSQLSRIIESLDVDKNAANEDVEDSSSDQEANVPDLSELFRPGQYVRAVVINVHASGATDIAGLSRSRDGIVRSSSRVELSLIPEKVNAGVQKGDLRSGCTLSAAVQSVEDHGYILDLGVAGASGFLPFKEARKSGSDDELRAGCLVNVAVVRMSSNGRTCHVTNDPATLVTSLVSEVTSATSVLPGMLVKSLVTAVTPFGLNFQLLGFFDATADEYHQSMASEPPQVGQKINVRVLYNIPGTSPPRFSVTLSDHHLALQEKTIPGDAEEPSFLNAFPIGTVLEAVKVVRVEQEHGLLMQVQPCLHGFVHISQVSDDHTPALSTTSGPWKTNTLHRARVIGHHIFDGTLQLSLRPSIFEQKFVQAGEIRVGEVLKGTIKRLTDSALFVSISGNADGVIWPNHYADIPLKHPTKRFKVGASIKCRVLTVEPERKRVVLTAKKTLLDTTVPILTSYEDAQVGFITHSVIFGITDKFLKVEFFNNVKAIIPAHEASESAVKLTEAFSVGKIVKVRIMKVDANARRIAASIRQVSTTFGLSASDVSGISVGDTVQGTVVELRKTNVVLTLKPSGARGLISFAVLARLRGVTISELEGSLNPGTDVEPLVVVSRDLENGLVVLGGSSKSRTKLNALLSMKTVVIGQVVGGRITRHGRRGAHVKLTTRIAGSLHPTDVCDDYDLGNPFPPVDSVIKATVVGIDEGFNHLSLSTRPSRRNPGEAGSPVDREINSVDDLKVGDTVRGFIKSVAEHGLFVMLGRAVDARVQIRELFDEYVKDWKSCFATNQLVKGRILNVDVANKKVELTFKSGDLTRKPSTLLSLGDLREGQKVMGQVKRIEQYGLFIQIDDSKVSGLCHKSQLSDNRDADVTVALRTFREGDRVKAIILTRDLEKKQLALSLKPSHFIGDEESEGDVEHPQGGANSSVGAEIEEDENDDDRNSANFAEEEKARQSDDDSDPQDDVDMSMQVDIPQLTPSVSLPSRHTLVEPSSLKLEGFQWFATEEVSDANTSSAELEDENETAPKKKRKKRKEIEHDLTADMHTKAPESTADFERLLLGSPDSSYLWIQYMSFYLKMSEVDKARAISKRAAQTINFREERERLNVWIALLNLENVYGTKATMETAFKDAARHNDAKTVYLRLAAIFDESQKPEEAEEQYRRTCKKFSRSSKVWTLFCEHYLLRGQLEEARKLLSRSLQSLEERKHIKTISKFGQLEYKLGDPERGRTIFEGIVDSHPKRFDLWSVYMDMEAKQQDIQHLRNLFNRVLAIKMTSYKAKSFFKKWLNLERKIGDEEGAMTVKQKAVEWTQQASV